MRHGRQRGAAFLLAATLTWAAWARPAAQATPEERPTPSRPAAVALALEPWLDGLVRPVAIATLPEPSDRMLVVQLEGLVLDVRGRTVSAIPFLDLRDRVTMLRGEQGLFTVALEPLGRAIARGRPRHVVAAFTERDTGDLVIAAYPVDEAAWVAAASGEIEVLRVPMPEPFHHGGQVRFGPDGFLYVSVGDGALTVGDGAATPAAPADALPATPLATPNDAALRGRLLRIDLLPTPDATPAYAIPVDNPFAGATSAAERPESWALGFRNPWKFTFDPRSGALLAVDVGADRWEEVNRVVPGGDHGWPAREGHACVRRTDGALLDPGCPTAAHVAPWLVYGHPELDPDGGRAIVGGVVVRDPDLPDLRDRYLFGDFVSGRLWSADPDGRSRSLLLNVGPGLTAVDEGPAGEVLLVTLPGIVWRLVMDAGRWGAAPEDAATERQGAAASVGAGASASSSARPYSSVSTRR